MFVFAVCTLIPLTLLPRYHYYRRVLGTSTFPVLFTVVLLLLLANSIIVPSATLLWLADPHPITEIPSSVFSAIAEIALQVHARHHTALKPHGSGTARHGTALHGTALPGMPRS